MEDEVICTCMDVYRSEIVKAIKEKSLKSVEDVGEETGAGTICGGCQEDIEAILEEINGQ